MNKVRYYCDKGSLLLWHSSGAKIYLDNHYGDGCFSYYVCEDTIDEFLKEKKLKYNDIVSESLWLDSKGWKVMDQDCTDHRDGDTIDAMGTELDSDYITIYRKGTTFIFCLNKHINNY